MQIIKQAFLLIAITTYSQDKDIWSGEYILKSIESIPTDTIKIKKIPNLSKEDVAGRFESDLKRWEIYSENDDDKVSLRRFLFDQQDDENEYEEFGWTALHVKGKMECIDAGHFFICQTTPNSQVTIDDYSFFTETGVFGIRLHYGLFQLEKLK